MKFLIRSVICIAFTKLALQWGACLTFINTASDTVGWTEREREREREREPLDSQLCTFSFISSTLDILRSSERICDV